MPVSIQSYSRAAASIALCVSALLAGCTVQVRPAAPAVYVPPAPPPPPAPAVVAEAPGVSADVQVAPPPLPDYEQPPIPAEGYLWTPGYWAWGPGGYYWVPGTWVQPPSVGLLWTPGYWGFVGGVYVFHAGYWGPHVGFYGGVNYGFGYTGVGFAGGHWVGGAFAYNRAVTNINVTVVHNTYNQTVINNNVTVNRVSFNGGAGGTTAVPTAQERSAMREPHVAPTPLQQQHVQEASHNPALFAKANGGRPAIAATARPASFNGPGVVGAHGAAPLARAGNFSPSGSGAMPTHSGAYPRGGQWNGNGNGSHANANGHGFVAGQPNAQHGGGQPNGQNAGGSGQPQSHKAKAKSQGGSKPPPKKQPAEKHEDKR